MAALAWVDMTPYLCGCNLAILVPVLVIAEAVRRREPRAFKGWLYAAVALTVAFWLTVYVWDRSG